MRGILDRLAVALIGPPIRRTYNHTQEDSPLYPCPECAETAAERLLALTLAEVKAEVTELRKENRELHIENSRLRGVAAEHE